MDVVPGSTADGGGQPVRVTVLSRAGCHLCDQAVEVVRAYGEAHGVGWTVLDLDCQDPALLARYTDLVPVVLVDDEPVATWTVTPEQLRAALRPRRQGRLWEILHKALG